MRSTLPDRPGALASLAERCGLADVNILGLQIFPDLDSVTDELVLRTPDDWDAAKVATLIRSADGVVVSVAACAEDALFDQPTRYVQAARAILAQPASFPDVLARLFDAGDVTAAGASGDVMELTVGDVQVQIGRTAPFTATEHARGKALADLVSDVLERSMDSVATGAVMGAVSAHRRLGGGSQPEYVVDGVSVSAMADGLVVGLAALRTPSPQDPGAVPVTLRVDPSWQRRGIGTRLLMEISRIAHREGGEEILLVTRSDNQAVLPMVLAAGMRGRIRMSGDELSVRVPVRELRPSQRQDLRTPS